MKPVSAESRLLADAAKLTGGCFRRVISEADQMYSPLDSVKLAEAAEAGTPVQVARGDGNWQNLKGVEQLSGFVRSSLQCGLQLAEALAPPVARAGLLLSDSSGRIEQLMLQCPAPGNAQMMAPAWDILSQQLGADAEMVVAVPAGKDGDKIRAVLEQQISHPEKLHFVTNSSPYRMSMWSRDTVLPLSGPDGRTTLVVPQRRYWAGGDPENNSGDVNVPWIMAGANLNQPLSARPQLWVSLDGGNVVNNATTAFVGEDTLKNTSRLLSERGQAQSDSESVRQLENLLGKKVVVLPQAAFHLDLYCTPLGENKMLVGDPALALQLLQDLSPQQRHENEKGLAEQADVLAEGLLQRYSNDPERQARFDAVAEQLKGLGYEVERVPCLTPAERGDPTLSYNNVLIEDYVEGGAAVKKVYLPQYGCTALDRAARQTYESLGYTAVGLPLAELSCMQGSLRCSALPTHRQFDV